jgi:hypothetical protein
MEIPAGARVCPFCRSAISLWRRMGPWLSVAAPLLIFLGLVFALSGLGRGLLEGREPIREPARWQGKLQVSEAKLQLPPEAPDGEVAIVATLRNDADETFLGAGFHVEIFDADGNLVDAVQPGPGWSIPPRTQLTVRLLLPLRADPQRYTRCDVRIVRAFQGNAL